MYKPDSIFPYLPSSVLFKLFTETFLDKVYLKNI